MAQAPKVENTDTGWNIIFDDLTVGVSKEQARNEQQAIEVAKNSYKQYKKDMEEKK